MVLNLVNACLGTSSEDGKENTWGSVSGIVPGLSWGSRGLVDGTENGRPSD